MIVKEGRNGVLIGRLKELPLVYTQGESVEELKTNIGHALKRYLDDLRENPYLFSYLAGIV
ncbi:MAG: hypothetical protein LBQ78_07750 [Tannerellaceae bacterium]|nr:hypothetical protein [Tannerellaceae bacterium]